MATVPAVLVMYGGQWLAGRIFAAVRDVASGVESGVTVAETRLLIRLTIHDVDRLLSAVEARLQIQSHDPVYMPPFRIFGLAQDEMDHVDTVLKPLGGLQLSPPPSDRPRPHASTDSPERPSGGETKNTTLVRAHQLISSL